MRKGTILPLSFCHWPTFDPLIFFLVIKWPRKLKTGTLIPLFLTVTNVTLIAVATSFFLSSFPPNFNLLLPFSRLTPWEALPRKQKSTLNPSNLFSLSPKFETRLSSSLSKKSPKNYSPYFYPTKIPNSLKRKTKIN